MTFDLSVSRVREFIRVTVNGLSDVESIKGSMQELATTAKSFPETDLLVDVRRALAKASLSDITECVSMFSQLGIGEHRRIALLVDEHRLDEGSFSRFRRERVAIRFRPLTLLSMPVTGSLLTSCDPQPL
jgi:hypothetical protein